MKKRYAWVEQADKVVFVGSYTASKAYYTRNGGDRNGYRLAYVSEASERPKLGDNALLGET